MPLNLIFGPMFSGKTTKLVEIYNNLVLSSVDPNTILVINHTIDTRTAKGVISTHDFTSDVPCVHLDNLMDALKYASWCNCEYILINEAQFFGDLIEFANTVDLNSKTVYVSGLNGDYKQEAFGNIHSIIPMADNVTFLKGRCSICNGASVFTKRIVNNDAVTLVGASDYYEPRCRKCLSL